MSIGEKIVQLRQIRNNIGNAISSKGITVGNVMTSFAGAIRDIPHQKYELSITINYDPNYFASPKLTFEIISLNNQGAPTTITKQVTMTSGGGTFGFSESNVIGYRIIEKSIDNFNRRLCDSESGTIFDGSTDRPVSGDRDLLNLQINGPFIILLSNVILRVSLRN